MEKRHFWRDLFFSLGKRFFAHEVRRTGAELAYMFLFALIPSLISLNALVGLLPLDLSTIVKGIPVIPKDVQDIVLAYLRHLSRQRNMRLLLTGLVLSFYSGGVAIRTLVIVLNRAYGITKRRPPLRQFLLSAFFTAVILAQIFLSLMLLVAGSWLLALLSAHFPVVGKYGSLWSFISFLIVYVCGFAALTLLYTAAPMTKIRFREALPGAFAAETAWLAASGLFSFYASNLARYSVLYGSLAAVIVLMFWFFLTGIILIMGGELNAALAQMRIKNNNK